MVAIPTLRWACTVNIASLMLKLGKMSEMAECPFDFSFRSSSGPSGLSYGVDHQRNLLAKHALDGGHEWLWFIDSDTLPDDSFIHMFTHMLKDDVDAVAGIYPLFAKAPDPPVAWTYYEWAYKIDKVTGERLEGFALADPNRPNPIVVGGAAGTGFMAIRRRVLESPKMRVGDDPLLPAIFKLQYDICGRLIATEDMDFCRRMRDNGFKLIIDARVKCGHVKTHDVKWTEDAMQWAFNIGRGLTETTHVDPTDPDPVRPKRCFGPVRIGDANIGLADGVAESQQQPLRA
jgi:hypothetical protein